MFPQLSKYGAAVVDPLRHHYSPLLYHKTEHYQPPEQPAADGQYYPSLKYNLSLNQPIGGGGGSSNYGYAVGPGKEAGASMLSSQRDEATYVNQKMIRKSQKRMVSPIGAPKHQRQLRDQSFDMKREQFYNNENLYQNKSFLLPDQPDSAFQSPPTLHNQRNCLPQQNATPNKKLNPQENEKRLVAANQVLAAQFNSQKLDNLLVNQVNIQYNPRRPGHVNEYARALQLQVTRPAISQRGPLFLNAARNFSTRPTISQRGPQFLLPALRSSRRRSRRSSRSSRRRSSRSSSFCSRWRTTPSKSKASLPQ